MISAHAVRVSFQSIAPPLATVELASGQGSPLEGVKEQCRHGRTLSPGFTTERAAHLSAFCDVSLWSTAMHTLRGCMCSVGSVCQGKSANRLGSTGRAAAQL